MHLWERLVGKQSASLWQPCVPLVHIESMIENSRQIIKTRGERLKEAGLNSMMHACLNKRHKVSP